MALLSGFVTKQQHTCTCTCTCTHSNARSLFKGVTEEKLKELRNQKPEMRQAQRDQALRCVCVCVLCFEGVIFMQPILKPILSIFVVKQRRQIRRSRRPRLPPRPRFVIMCVCVCGGVVDCVGCAYLTSFAFRIPRRLPPRLLPRPPPRLLKPSRRPLLVLVASDKRKTSFCNVKIII